MTSQQGCPMVQTSTAEASATISAPLSPGIAVPSRSATGSTPAATAPVGTRRVGAHLPLRTAGPSTSPNAFATGRPRSSTNCSASVPQVIDARRTCRDGSAPDHPACVQGEGGTMWSSAPAIAGSARDWRRGAVVVGDHWSRIAASPAAARHRREPESAARRVLFRHHRTYDALGRFLSTESRRQMSLLRTVREKVSPTYPSPNGGRTPIALPVRSASP